MTRRRSKDDHANDPTKNPPFGEINKTEIAHAEHFDYDEFTNDLEGLDLTEAQQRDLLATLWDITYQFARLGFGQESTQLALASVMNSVAQDSGNTVEIEMPLIEDPQKEV